MATTLGDVDFLSRVGCSDLLAMKAQYHVSCLTEYRNKYKKCMHEEKIKTEQEQDDLVYSEEEAFVKVVQCVENKLTNNVFVFRLSELRKMYASELNRNITQVNYDTFKKKVLNYFPEANERMVGNRCVIWFIQAIDNLINDSRKCITTEDVAATIRTDIGEHENKDFNGTFDSESQSASVPASLKRLISNIICGDEKTMESKS